MSQSFQVNGKKYLPSNELAVAFGYTPDYIGKLAREEKIIGTQVGRQWFIEPESLNTFLLKTNIEKEIRKSELSAKRKIEHALHKSSETTEVLFVPSSVPALMQTVSVLVCGLLVGGLGWLVSFEQISSPELTSGVVAIKNSLFEQVVPHEFDLAVVTELSETLMAATSDGVAKQTHISGVFNEASVGHIETNSASVPAETYATLPLRSIQRDSVLQATSTESTSKTLITSNIPKISDTFSDEVQIVVGANGEELIAPVFKSQSSSSQLFRLVPVTDKKK